MSGQELRHQLPAVRHWGQPATSEPTFSASFATPATLAAAATEPTAEPTAAAESAAATS